MIRPMPAYFVISIPKKEQADRKARIGSIFLHPSFVYMTRGMQCGQIVAIGERAGQALPEARLGDTLLVHHFVESYEKTNCIAVDEYFYYYVVTAMSHNGQNNQTYGVFDGRKIIPHSDYLFLETKQPVDRSLTPEEYLEEELQQQKSGLFTFKEWKIDIESIRKQIAEIKGFIDSLTKTRMNPEIAKVIKEKEAEMDRLSKMLQQQRFELYTIIAGNRQFFDQVEEHYHTRIGPGARIYMLNIACQTKMEFNKVEYIVAKSAHFGAPQAWVRNQLNKESVSISS